VSQIDLSDYCTFQQLAAAFPGPFPLSERQLVQRGYRGSPLPFLRPVIWRKTDVCNWLSKRYSDELVAKVERALGVERTRK